MIFNIKSTCCYPLISLRCHLHSHTRDIGYRLKIFSRSSFEIIPVNGEELRSCCARCDRDFSSSRISSCSQVVRISNQTAYGEKTFPLSSDQRFMFCIGTVHNSGLSRSRLATDLWSAKDILSLRFKRITISQQPIRSYPKLYKAILRCVKP